MFRHDTENSPFSSSRNLQKLSLYGDTCILQDDGILDSSYLSQVDQGGKKMKEYVLKLTFTRVNWLQAGFANILAILLVVGTQSVLGCVHNWILAYCTMYTLYVYCLPDI